MIRHLKLLVVLLAVAAGGCAQTSFRAIDKLGPSSERLSIVVMPIDVQLSELSAGGVKIANAAWTQSAEAHMHSALSQFAETRNASITELVPEDEDQRPDAPIAQLSKLHGVVGETARAHVTIPAFRLPNKGDTFDWTLGASVRELADRTNARYALFVYVRDSYASAGRIMVIAAAAVFGVAVPGGQQHGYASLVDLENGNLVWFNSLSRGAGDLRNPEAARETVELLMKDFPQ